MMYKQLIHKFNEVITKKAPNIKALVTFKNTYGTEKTTSEAEIKAILEKRFPAAKSISVEDVSGGCGAMYDIFVESSDFKGLTVVKQHQTVTNTLKEQIKLIHGLRIVTKAA